MIILTIEEIVQMHSKLVVRTGGSDGIRDQGLLESAVFCISNGFGDHVRYPSIEEKAARLAYGIVSNHAFIDGNKRIGVLVMLMTLRLNRMALSYSQNELIQLGIGLAGGNVKYDQVLDWIRGHRT